MQVIEAYSRSSLRVKKCTLDTGFIFTYLNIIFKYCLLLSISTLGEPQRFNPFADPLPAAKVFMIGSVINKQVGKQFQQVCTSKTYPSYVLEISTVAAVRLYLLQSDRILSSFFIQIGSQVVTYTGHGLSKNHF